MKCLFQWVRKEKLLTIILYSTHCPRCNVLEKKLKQKNISYEEVNNIGIMKEKGYMSVPVLEVDGMSMDFKIANDWINSQEEI